MLVSRQPGVKTVFKRNPAWWASWRAPWWASTHLPIGNDATRTAALLGRGGLCDGPACATSNACGVRPASQLVDGQKPTVFIGMDQSRDKLLWPPKSPETRKPFKDLVRAPRPYQAIDIQAIKAVDERFGPHRRPSRPAAGAYNDAALESRSPYDLAAACS